MTSNYTYTPIDRQENLSQSHLPRLPKEELNIDDSRGIYNSDSDSKKHRIWRLATQHLIPLLIVFLAGLFLGRFSSQSSRLPNKSRLVAPLELKAVEKEFIDHEIFAVPPSTSSDAEWSAILPKGNGWVRLQPPGRSKSSPVQPDEIFNIATYHQLHCLNQLRVASYRGASSPEPRSDTITNSTDGNLAHTTTTSGKDPAHHFKHCIEYLRQSILCSVDAALEPFDTAKGGTLTWGVKHQCRDEQTLRTWAEENRLWERQRISELPEGEEERR